MEWECCWTKEQIEPEECLFLTGGEEDREFSRSLRLRITELCLECPRFRTDLKKFREEGHPLAPVFTCLIEEFREQREHNQSIVNFLDSRNREIKFLHELGVVLQTSVDLEEVLSVALTAITAGKGFGMNRAFLLLADKERQYLRGYLGVGPKTHDEAWQIWEEIHHDDFNLQELARNFYREKLSTEKAKFHDILERLTIPLNNHSILLRALKEKRAILVENAFTNPDVEPELAQTLGVDSFLIAPLISRGRRIGLILADNCITRRPITPKDMQSIETFAFPVAFAIERASLYERLQEELDNVTAANKKLQEQQELIVKMEKMALVGQITSSVAHSIRNPLMIIGGFARSLMKRSIVDDPNREYLQSIIDTARQLESVLEEVLAYSDSLHPAKDDWDIEQILKAVSYELQPEFEKQGVTCELELAEEALLVFVDFKQLSYCLKNILKLSLSTMADGGIIRLKTAREYERVVLTITDTGKLLDPSFMATGKIPFSISEELGKGSGMPPCSMIMERHGITLVIEENNGCGNRFIIHFKDTKEETGHGENTGG